jgi:hypothetical protein
MFMAFLFRTAPRSVVLFLLITIGCGAGSSDQLAIPDTPDGTVRVVVDGLVQHHPEIVWNALPASYQQDVSDLSREFAETVDPSVFDRAVAVVRKGVVVLQSKKGLILSSRYLEQSHFDVETVDVLWEASIHMIDSLLASDLADLATLKEIDVEAFLSTTGTALMDSAAEMPAESPEMVSFSERAAVWEQIEVELLSKDGERAVVLLTVPDKEPIEMPMVLIEDRWIPTELSTQWPVAVDRARTRIEMFGSDEAAQIRVQVLFGIGIVEGFIDQIVLMETTDEFDDLVGGVLGNVMATQGGSPAITEG